MTPIGTPQDCTSLAAKALAHARSTELALGQHAAEDAIVLIDRLVAQGRSEERRAAAEAAIMTGEALHTLHDAHRAARCFGLAVDVLARHDDALAHAARARVGLAKALRTLSDPAARAIFEDAGELYEELGDERAVREIDLALRELQAELEESPRSFHARPSAFT